MVLLELSGSDYNSFFLRSYPWNNRTKPNPPTQKKQIYCSVLIFYKVDLGNFVSLYKQIWRAPGSSRRGNDVVR